MVSEDTIVGSNGRFWTTAKVLACAGVLSLPLGACTAVSFTQTQQRGYVLQEGALEQVPVGSTKDQVLFVLGTPTTISNFENETFYYISQTVERLPGMTPRIVDQKVLAVYFDGQGRVARIANFGLQDGKVFDFVTRTTPAGGRETTFLQQLFTNLTR